VKRVGGHRVDSARAGAASIASTRARMVARKQQMRLARWWLTGRPGGMALDGRPSYLGGVCRLARSRRRWERDLSSYLTSQTLLRSEGPIGPSVRNERCY
jgi:hypothetical protein